MTKKTGPVVYDGWFNWQVPHGFELENGDDGMLSVHTGTGSFYISCFDRTAPMEPTPMEAARMAERFAKEQGWRVKADAVKSRMQENIPLAEFELDDKQRPASHWHVWHLLAQDRAVLITYVCPEAEGEEERETRNQMIASFAWEPLE